MNGAASGLPHPGDIGSDSSARAPSGAASSRGAKRSRISPLWANRPIEPKPWPITGRPSRTASVITATMLVVSPPDGIAGSA
jgi:hypothetical protein